MENGEPLTRQRWKDELKETIEKYTEIVRIGRKTRISACMGHIENKFGSDIGSFRLEATGKAIRKAVDIAEIVERNSKRIWGTEDFIEKEGIQISTVKGQNRNYSKISILLSKHSFLKAKQFMEDLSKISEFDPRKIIFILKDECKIDILYYLEKLSEDPFLDSYFQCLIALLSSARNQERLIEKVKEEREKFVVIDRSKVQGFAQGIYDLYGVIEVTDNFLSVENVEDMSLLKQSIEDYYAKIDSPEKYTKIIYDRIIEISEKIDRLMSIDTLSYRLYYLDEARYILEDISGIVEKHFVEPFKTMYRIVFVKWRDMLNTAREKTRKEPKLQINTEYEKKPTNGKLNIKISFRNEGFVEIEDVKLHILKSEGFDIVDENPKVMERLVPNREEELFFKIHIAEKGIINVKYLLQFRAEKEHFKEERSFVVLLEEKHGKFKKISNPYVVGRALSPGGDDIFVGREEEFKLIEQNLTEPSKPTIFIIHGHRRTGKTSFLNFLPEKVSIDKKFVYLDMQLRQEESISTLLCSMAHIISRNMEIKEPNEEDFQNDPYSAFEEFLGHAVKKSKNGIVLMFDEFELIDEYIKDEKKDLEESILDFLRGIIHKEENLAIVFAGTFDQSKMSPKWKILFNVGVRRIITSLREPEARSLVEDHVENVLYSDIIIDKLLDLSGRNPFYLQVLCRFLIDRLNSKERNHATIDDIEAVQEDAVNSLEDSFSYLWDTLSFPEKSVCKTLAILQVTGSEWAKAQDIQKAMKEKKTQCPQIEDTLEDLFSKDILEKYSYKTPEYKFRIELLAHQVQKFGRCRNEERKPLHPKTSKGNE